MVTNANFDQEVKFGSVSYESYDMIFQFDIINMI